MESIFSLVVAGVSVAILLYLAVNDFRNYRIPNELIIALAALYVLHALLAGKSEQVLPHAGFAALMFVPLLLCYSQKLLGGGDVKLLIVCFLWTGIACALLFSIVLVIFSLIYVILARLKWVGAVTSGGRTKIAFAPAIAGALIVTIVVCAESF